MPEVQVIGEKSLIQKYRDSHHAVAKMVAIGATPSFIRQHTGYSTRRLSLLAADPTFQELVRFYSQRVEEKFEENLDTYLDLGMANMIRAEAQIAEHLDKSEEEGGELLPVAALDRISQGRADRFGYSKHNIVEHKHDFAAMLDKAVERSNKAKVIEGTIIGAPSPGERPAGSSAPLPPTATEDPKPQAVRRSFNFVLEQVKKRKIA